VTLPWPELLALALYGPLVVLWHELGHAVFASLGGYRVVRFQIGLGAPLARLGDVGSTHVTVGRLPFGGVCVAIPVRPASRRRVWFHAGGLVAQGALGLALWATAVALGVVDAGTVGVGGVGDAANHPAWLVDAMRFNALVFVVNGLPWRFGGATSDGWHLLDALRDEGRGVLEILRQRPAFERLFRDETGGSALARAWARVGLAWIDVVAGRSPPVAADDLGVDALAEAPYLDALATWVTAEAHRRASRPLAALRTARRKPGEAWSEDDVALLRLAEGAALVDLGEPEAARRALAGVVGARGIVARQALVVLLDATLDADREHLEHAAWRVMRRVGEAWLDPVATSATLWAAGERLDELNRRAAADGIREAARALADRTLRAAAAADRAAVRERLGPAAATFGQRRHAP
jgi:hypothetical protein